MKKSAFLQYKKSEKNDDNLEGFPFPLTDAENPDFKFMFQINAAKSSRAIVTAYNTDLNEETFFGHFCTKLEGVLDHKLYESLFTYTEFQLSCAGSTRIKIVKHVESDQGDFLILVAKQTICAISIAEIEKTLENSVSDCRNTQREPYVTVPWANRKNDRGKGYKEIMCFAKLSNPEKATRKKLSVCSREYFEHKKREYGAQQDYPDMPLGRIKEIIQAQTVLEWKDKSEKIDHLASKLINRDSIFLLFIATEKDGTGCVSKAVLEIDWSRKFDSTRWKSSKFAQLRNDTTIPNSRKQISPYGPLTDLTIIPNGDHFLAFSKFGEEGNSMAKIYKERLDSCENYKSCETCLAADADPLCGWCMMTGTCSTRNSCPDRRFKERNKYQIPQCPQISGSDELADYSIEDYKPESGLDIVVQNLPGCGSNSKILSCYPKEDVQCRYEIGKRKHIVDPKAVGTVFGGPQNLSQLRFFCNMLEKQQMTSLLGSQPEIEIKVDLIFKENSQQIVSGSFKVFDCRKFSSCGSCLGMSNSCVWCYTDNVCAPDRNHCKGSVRTKIFLHQMKKNKSLLFVRSRKDLLKN